VLPVEAVVVVVVVVVVIIIIIVVVVIVVVGVGSFQEPPAGFLGRGWSIGSSSSSNR